MVEITDVDKIYLVIIQCDKEVLRKEKADATIDVDGFTWELEQTDTSKLSSARSSFVQFDYTSGSARYTTAPKEYIITNSAINEVI